MMLPNPDNLYAKVYIYMIKNEISCEETIGNT